MKITKRLASLILALIFILGTALCSVSAAHRDTPELGAYTGLLPIGAQPVNSRLTSSADELPVSYNSNSEGLVFPVRTQQNNTCWAFGALSTFETLLLANGEEISPFAPQHPNLWATKREDGTGWQRNDQNGGYSYIPLGYLTGWTGPVYDADFPTSSTKEDYDAFSTPPEYVLTQAIFFNDNAQRNAIKELIYTYGAVVGNFNADSDYLSNKTSFYCNNQSLTISQLSGHCISVVGWDDAYSKENFAHSASGTPQSDGAWLIKNSWGAQYNNIGGYFWISYEDVWMFDSIFGPSYAFTDYERLTNNHKIYQNEIDGATYEFDYFSSESEPYNAITYMNVFDFKEEHRTLSKVVFETTSTGADYTVYYIPTAKGKPTKDTSKWTELAVGTVDYTGYICVDTADTLLPEGKGAIGITIDNERTYLENKDKKGYTYIPNSIGVCEWLFSGNKYIFLPGAEKGLSYYMKDGVLRDVMDFYQKDFYDDIGGTFVIKAITNNDEANPPKPLNPTVPTIPTEPEETTVPTQTTNPTETTAPTNSTETTSTAPTDNTETTVPNNSTVPNLPRYLTGDADLSGVVNVKDATTVQKHIANLITLNDTALLAADATKDGNVNVKDATQIQKFVAGLVELCDVIA